MSDGGQHITVSPLPSTFAFRSFVFLIFFFNSIIDLTFPTACCSVYLCPELTQRSKFVNCLAGLILEPTAPVYFWLCSAKVLTVQPVISQCEVFGSSTTWPSPLNSIPSFPLIPVCVLHPVLGHSCFESIPANPCFSSHMELLSRLLCLGQHKSLTLDVSLCSRECSDNVRG